MVLLTIGVIIFVQKIWHLKLRPFFSWVRDVFDWYDGAAIVARRILQTQRSTWQYDVINRTISLLSSSLDVTTAEAAASTSSKSGRLSARMLFRLRMILNYDRSLQETSQNSLWVINVLFSSVKIGAVNRRSYRRKPGRFNRIWGAVCCVLDAMVAVYGLLQNSISIIVSTAGNDSLQFIVFLILSRSG